MKDDFLKICFLCNKKFAILIEEPRYNGFRGICLNCGGNWPES